MDEAGPTLLDMRRSTKWLLLGGTAGAAAALASTYGLSLRPWHLQWGATAEEAKRPMPFDELIRHPNYVATRAITVAAPPDLVWRFVTERSALPRDTVIRHLEEQRCVAFAPPEPEADASWVVVLMPVDGGTRVISRNRAHFHRRLSAVLRYLLVDPGQFLFERQWLLSIKERAEQEAAGGSEFVDR
jgi:hypothetical protein